MHVLPHRDEAPDELIEMVGPEEANALFWEFREGRQLQMRLALERQRRIAAQNHAAEHTSVDGLGQCMVRVDPQLYYQLCAYFGKEEVDSPGFWTQFDRDNPDLLVRPTYRRKAMVTLTRTLADNAGEEAA